MRVMPVVSTQQQNVTVNNKKKHSSISFMGVQDIADEYDKKKKNLGFWKRHFTNQEEELEIKKNAEILGYAKASEEKSRLYQTFLDEKRKELEDARKGNANESKIKELEEQVRIANKSLEIQKELAKTTRSKGWGRIAGYDSEKTILQSEFIDLIALEKAGNKDIIFPNGILFFGPTGNGKTTFANAFAEQSQCNLIKIEPTELDIIKALNKALQESKEYYEKHQERSIILIDEFDAFGLKSEQGGDRTLIPRLKAMLISSAEENKATFFLTTNVPRNIDPVLLVDSRVPIRVFLDPPDKQNVSKVFAHYLDGKTPNYLNYDNLAMELYNQQKDGAFSNSKIKSIVETCYKKLTKVSQKITEDSLISQIKETIPDITKEMLDKYKLDKKVISTIK